MSQDRKAIVDAGQLKVLCCAAALFAMEAPRLSRDELERHARALLGLLSDFGAIGVAGGQPRPWELRE